jgi:hypothetical protein
MIGEKNCASHIHGSLCKKKEYKKSKTSKITIIFILKNIRKQYMYVIKLVLKTINANNSCQSGHHVQSFQGFLFKDHATVTVLN